MSAPTATASVSVTEMGTVLTLKQLAELYLQDFISNDEYTEAETQAKRKLARIIEREGDADGERLKPYYLAQLVAEAVTAERFSNYCRDIHVLRTLEKKKCPQPKPQGKSKSVSLLYHKVLRNAIGGCKNV